MALPLVTGCRPRPSSTPLAPEVWITPPPLVVTVPPVTLPCSTTTEPAPIASMVPPTLFTALTMFRSPPLVASIVPLFVMTLPPVLIVRAAVDWLALMMPSFDNTIDPLPMLPPPLIVLSLLSSRNVDVVAKIRLLVLADSTSLPPPCSVLVVCVSLIWVVVPVELSLIVPEFTIVPPIDITALSATLSVPAMPAPLVPELTVNLVAALMVSVEVAARASELMVMVVGESIGKSRADDHIAGGVWRSRWIPVGRVIEMSAEAADPIFNGHNDFPPISSDSVS